MLVEFWYTCMANTANRTITSSYGGRASQITLSDALVPELSNKMFHATILETKVSLTPAMMHWVSIGQATHLLSAK